MVYCVRIGEEKHLPDSDMQEQKNKRRFILLVLLLAMTAVVYWFDRAGGQDEIDKTIFRKVDFKTIDQVTLQSPTGNVVLALNGSRWQVNGKYEADRNMIDVLFATLHQVEPKRPLPAHQQDSIARVIEKEGVKISLFSGGVVADSFYAGGNSQKTQGYFHRQGDESYVMTIPGYRVYVSGIFELPEKGWRDKLVFQLNWRNLESVDVTFGQKKSDNFRVAMAGEVLSIEGVQAPDTTRLYDFLDAVSLLTVEAYLDSNAALDSLAGTPPGLGLEVKDIANRSHSIRLYQAGPGKFVGFINNSQWCTLAPASIQPVFRPRSYFVKP